MKAKLIIIFVFLSFILTSCQWISNPSSNVPKEVLPIEKSENYQKDLSQLIQSNAIIPSFQHNSLVLTDSITNKSLEVYKFTKENIPARRNIDSFVISPSKNWIVWYSSNQGFTALNVKKRETQIIHGPSIFLNTNPYIDFLQETEIVAFISDNGNIFNKVNLEDNTDNEIPIPYPYGNLFKVSPDGNSIFFIAGYGQVKDNKPQFMFTDINGQLIREITTDTDIADRHLAVWAPDSSGIILVNNNAIQYHPLSNPDQATIIFSLPESKGNIIDIKRINDKIFLLGDQGYWHIYSYIQQKQVARTPIAIAEELNNPRFIPWTEQNFMIEETVIGDKKRHKRLWLSDFRGKKTIVVPNYDERIVEQEPLIID